VARERKEKEKGKEQRGEEGRGGEGRATFSIPGLYQAIHWNGN
jgi:hypothetical protein